MSKQIMVFPYVIFHGILPWHQFCLAKGPAGTLNWHQSFRQAHILDNSLQSHKQKWVPDMTSPAALVINSLPSLPGLCPMCHLDKTPPPPQSIPCGDSNKGVCPLPLPVPCFVWPLQVCHVLPQGPMSNKLLYFSVFCILLSSHNLPSSTLCST